MRSLLSEILMDFSAEVPARWRSPLLRFSAEGAFGGAGLERLAAVPAEAWLGRIAGPEPRLDVRNAVVTPGVRSSLPRRSAGTPHRLAGGQHVLEHLGRPAV